MQITYPITDYIKQSILTTKGDLVVEGVTVPERLAGAALDLYLKSQGAGNTPIYAAMTLRDVGIKIGNSTRSTGGSQAITGVGFKPSVIILLARDATSVNNNWSVGFSNAGTDMCMTMSNNGTVTEDLFTISLNIRRDGTNVLSGQVVSRDSDGFTITWTLTNTVSLSYIYICLP